MSTFTCIACHVAFSNFEVQREHYKSDWHRYNLKRKVAELPPVTAENFQLRVLAQRSQIQTESEVTARYCNFCRKNFSTENAFFNHLKAKKHLEAEQKHVEQVKSDVNKKNVKNTEKDMNDLEQMEETLQQQRQQKDVQNFLKKMDVEKRPDSGLKSYASPSSHAGSSSTAAVKSSETDDEDEDMEEWTEEDGEALGLEECLFCSFLSSDLEANVKHMTTTHSFFLPDVEYLTDLEGLVGYLAEKVGIGNICLWCNDKGKAFATAKSVQQHMIDKGHCKLLHEGTALEEYADFYDYSSSYPDNEDGTVDPDQEVEIDSLDDEGFQMVLPSGAVIGHRSLMRYYRQNLPPARPPANKRLLHTVMSHYRALGWTGMTGEAAIRKARDISLMHMRRSKQHLSIGMKHNKCLQKHFRQQVMF